MTTPNPRTVACPTCEAQEGESCGAAKLRPATSSLFQGMWIHDKRIEAAFDAAPRITSSEGW